MTPPKIQIRNSNPETRVREINVPDNDQRKRLEDAMDRALKIEKAELVKALNMNAYEVDTPEKFDAWKKAQNIIRKAARSTLNELPRRVYHEKNTPEELQLRILIESVQRLGNDRLLTNCVNLLTAAFDQLADWNDKELKK